MFYKFKNRIPKKAGFYIFRYADGRTLSVFVHSFNKHYSNVYSYFVSMENTRDKNTCHDFGQYIWVNSYSGICPTEYRKMTIKEALEFSNKLFEFGRPSWANKSGKNVLTADKIRRCDW